MKKYITNSYGQRIHVVENTFGGNALFILCHGFTSSSEGHVIRSMRHVLTENKRDHVAVDFTNNLNESDGDFEHHTISLEVEDLAHVYAQYHNRYDQVYLLGHSMGCIVASQFALKTPVSGLVLIAPPYNMVDVILSFAEGDKEAAIARWKEEGTVPIFKEDHNRHYPLRFQFYEDALSIPYDKVCRVSCPTLVVYSDTDSVVHPSHPKTLFATISSKEKEIVNLSGADHSFTEPPYNQQLQTHVMQWIKKQEVQ